MPIGWSWGCLESAQREEATIPPSSTIESNSFNLISRLYIHGGYDIREGSLNTLWMLDLGKLSQLEKSE